MAYTVQLTKQAEKNLLKVNKKYLRNIRDHISSLQNDPRPPGSVKLSGSEDEYRIRVGVYRILYKIQDEVLLITVIDVDVRGNVYRNR